MDEHGIVIELVRRAKGSPSKGDGPMLGDKSGSADYEDVKRSAAQDLAKAFGIDPEKIDVDAACAALDDYHDACGGPEEDSAEGEGAG